MGIGAPLLNLTFTLWKEGRFKDFKSVVELGAQDIKENETEVDIVLSGITRRGMVATRDPKAPRSSYSPKILYRELGLGEYQCIDADGSNQALVYDLNEDLRKQGFDKVFDLVTNHGTTEHCFNQYNAFLNIHNLCAKGGIMIHGLPFQGYLNHGLFNYQPNFFLDLARANAYEVLGVYVSLDAGSESLVSYTDSLMKHISLRSVSEASLTLVVALQKTSDAPFRSPYDGKYLNASKIEGTYAPQILPKTYLPLNLSEIGEAIPARSLARLLAKRIQRKIRSYFL